MAGSITDDDKELLRGNKEDVSERAREQQRTRLRRRIRESFADFTFLIRHLNSEDYKAIFQPSKADKGEIHLSAVSTLGFFYLGIENHTEHDFSELLGYAKEAAQFSQEFSQEEVVKLTGECSSCGAENGIKLSNPTRAALFATGLESICSCGETVQLTP